MKKTLSIVLYGSILVACNTSYIPDTHTSKYCFSADDIENSVSFDSIVRNLEYIPLETVPEAKLGEISDLIVDGDDFFIVTEGVYCLIYQHKIGVYNEHIFRYLWIRYN